MVFLLTRIVTVLWSLVLLVVLCLSLPLAFAVGKAALGTDALVPTPTTPGSAEHAAQETAGVLRAPSPPSGKPTAVPTSTYSTGLLLGMLYFLYYVGNSILAATTSPWSRQKRRAALLKPVAKLVSHLEAPAVFTSLYVAFRDAFASAKGIPAWLEAVRWIAAGPWSIYLTLLGPVFALLEAGAAVILAQLAGQRSRELVHDGKDALGYFLVAGCIAVYYYVVRTAYHVLKTADLTVAEGSMTTLFFAAMLALTFTALYTSRGTIVDASLVFGYVMYSIRHATTRASPADVAEHGDLQRVSSVITDGLQDLFKLLNFHLISGAAGHTLEAVRSCLATDALVALAFRVAIFLAFVKVLPTLLARRNTNEYGQSAELKEAVDKLASVSGETVRAPPSVLSKAQLFAMPAAVAYYTHSLFTYYMRDQFVDPHVWRWTAGFVAVGLYGSEMAMRGPDEFADYRGGYFSKEE